MKTKTLFITLILSTLLTGCCLKHKYLEPSCTEPATCIKCGETEGEKLPHTWIEGNCTEAKHCSVCGITEGQPLGHKFSESTCTEDAKCLTCGAIGEKAKGHDFKEADYVNPKTCKSCGLTEGEPLPVEENTESLEVETPKTDTRTKEQIDADVQAVIDEIYRRRGIDPNTMRQGHIDAPPPEGGTPADGVMPPSNFGSSGPSEHLKGAVIQ